MYIERSIEIPVTITGDLLDFVCHAFSCSPGDAKIAIRQALEYQFFLSTDYLDKKVMHDIEFFIPPVKTEA